MKAILQTTTRVYARSFYEANAFVFLVLFGFTCGVLSGTEHMALATIFVSAPHYTLIPQVIWVLYASKVVRYNRHCGMAQENIFIRQLALTPRSVSWTVSILVTSEQCAPILLYGGFLMVVAAQLAQFDSALSVFAGLCVLVIVCASLLRAQWQRAEERSHTRLLTKLHQYPTLVLQWLTRSFPGLIVVAKGFNCLLLFGLCQLHRFEVYDYRFLALGVVITAGMSSFILQHVNRFENQAFGMVRALPVPAFRRVLWVLTVILFLQAPELITLRWNLPVTRTTLEFIELALLAIAIPFAVYAYLLKKPLTPDPFARQLFAITLGLFVMVLFKMPMIALIAVLSMYGMLYVRRFYKFEYLGGA